MPSSKFIRKTIIPKSFRNEKVKGMFDVEKNIIINEWDIDIPIETMKWNIGAIVGASGSGKTTTAKELFSNFHLFEGFDWNKENTIIDDFAKEFTPKQITEALSKVGFSSPPDWLKPYCVLSNGQKMRADMARLMLESDKPFIYDEFTSFVDRQVAQIGSEAIQKYIRKADKQFIAVTAHHDILEWLQPDWYYDMNKKEFHLKDSLRQRPKIELGIRKADQSEWKIFKSYHYLSADHNAASHKYIAEINKIIVGWCSILHFPHPTTKNLKRIHRVVVLPDYQGIGIGNHLLNIVAEMYKMQKMRVTITTSTPVFIHSLKNSNRWIMTRRPSRVTGGTKTAVLKDSVSSDRLTASFEFIGSK